MPPIESASRLSPWSSCPSPRMSATGPVPAPPSPVFQGTTGNVLPPSSPSKPRFSLSVSLLSTLASRCPSLYAELVLLGPPDPATERGVKTRPMVPDEIWLFLVAMSANASPTPVPQCDVSNSRVLRVEFTATARTRGSAVTSDRRFFERTSVRRPHSGISKYLPI